MGSGQPGGLGIGSNPGGEPDWTFAGSSSNYAKRTLYVLTGEAFKIPLEITSVSPDFSTNRVDITWTSSVGESFILSWSDDLEEFNEIEDGIVGGDGSTTFVDVVPEGTEKRFYQVTKE